MIVASAAFDSLQGQLVTKAAEIAEKARSRFTRSRTESRIEWRNADELWPDLERD